MPPTHAATAAPGARSARGHLLHVDDDPVSSLVLCEWLKLNGYTVDHADCPDQANPLLARGEYDLIISDIHMPGNHRLEWVETLLTAGCRAPILLMTGSPELETACRAANLPVSGYLIKPPDWAALDAKLQSAIADSRRRRDFLQLSGEILRLLDTRRHLSGPQESELATRLATLATTFSGAAEGRPPTPHAGGPAGREADSRWRHAIEDTIEVIERTKHSFRSKELGQLRRRLQGVLHGPRAA